MYDLIRGRNENNDLDNMAYSNTVIVEFDVPEDTDQQSHSQVLDDDDWSFEVEPSTMIRWTIRHQVSRQCGATESA